MQPWPVQNALCWSQTHTSFCLPRVDIEVLAPPCSAQSHAFNPRSAVLKVPLSEWATACYALSLLSYTPGTEQGKQMLEVRILCFAIVLLFVINMSLCSDNQD